MEIKNKKIIWLFNHYAYPPDTASSNRHFSLFKFFPQNYVIYIISSSFNHITKTYFSEDTMRINNINFNFIKTTSYTKNNIKRIINIFSYYINTKKTLKKLPKPNLIISSSVHQLAWLLGLKYSKRFKVPFISEVRDLWPQTLIDLGYISYYNPISIILRFIEKKVYSNSDYIISPLPYAFEYIDKIIAKDVKFKWIPNGIDICEIKFNLKNYTHEYIIELEKIKECNFLCLYTGSLGPANDPFQILNAAEYLQNENIFFIIIGQGVLLNELNDDIKLKQLKNIKILNFIENKYIPKILNIADILLLPSKYTKLYNYGVSMNKLYQYLAAGKPLIIPEIFRNNDVQKANCGLTYSHLIENDFAFKIQKLSKMNKKDLETMGENALSYVNKYFDYKNISQNLLKICKELINEND